MVETGGIILGFYDNNFIYKWNGLYYQVTKERCQFPRPFLEVRLFLRLFPHFLVFFLLFGMLPAFPPRLSSYCTIGGTTIGGTSRVGTSRVGTSKSKFFER